VIFEGEEELPVPVVEPSAAAVLDADSDAHRLCVVFLCDECTAEDTYTTKHAKRNEIK